MDIADNELPEEKRMEIAQFDGQYCGFPLLCKVLLDACQFEDPLGFLTEEDKKYKPITDANTGKGITDRRKL